MRPQAIQSKGDGIRSARAPRSGLARMTRWGWTLDATGRYWLAVPGACSCGPRADAGGAGRPRLLGPARP